MPSSTHAWWALSPPRASIDASLQRADGRQTATQAPHELVTNAVVTNGMHPCPRRGSPSPTWPRNTQHETVTKALPEHRFRPGINSAAPDRERA